MKKSLILLAFFLFLFTVSCEKETTINDTKPAIELKKKPANTSNFAIVPEGPVTLNVGETMQLSIVPDTSLFIDWYVIDQQIAYIYWDGKVKGIKPGITVVSAVHYRQNGPPYQDNIVVFVE